MAGEPRLGERHRSLLQRRWRAGLDGHPRLPWTDRFAPGDRGQVGRSRCPSDAARDRSKGPRRAIRGTGARLEGDVHIATSRPARRSDESATRGGPRRHLRGCPSCEDDRGQALAPCPDRGDPRDPVRVRCHSAEHSSPRRPVAGGRQACPRSRNLTDATARPRSTRTVGPTLTRVTIDRNPALPSFRMDAWRGWPTASRRAAWRGWPTASRRAATRSPAPPGGPQLAPRHRPRASGTHRGPAAEPPARAPPSPRELDLLELALDGLLALGRGPGTVRRAVAVR